MFIVQRYENGVSQFQDFDTWADCLTNVKNSQGLTEGEFFEFIITGKVFERPGTLYLCAWEGAMPSNVEAMKRIEAFKSRQSG